MKKLILFLCVAVTLCGCSRMLNDQQSAEFTVETAAMALGYELAGDFVWTELADEYYMAIMLGQYTIDGARIAEEYLRTVTHPIIANRLVKIASMIGFGLDENGNIIDISDVDIKLLQAAAYGFKTGLGFKNTN